MGGAVRSSLKRNNTNDRHAGSVSPTRRQPRAELPGVESFHTVGLPHAALAHQTSLKQPQLLFILHDHRKALLLIGPLAYLGVLLKPLAGRVHCDLTR